MFLEMKLTKSPSTEDGVKTSQMLWGVQLQNVIKPWVAPLKKGYWFPSHSVYYRQVSLPKHQTHFSDRQSTCFAFLMVSINSTEESF